MMKIRVIFLLNAVFLSAGCGSNKAMLKEKTTPAYELKVSQGESGLIDKDSAIAIAKKDAAKIYPSLETFDIFACETKKVWYVFFELKDTNLDGGSPEYVIDKKTGVVLRKTYHQ